MNKLIAWVEIPVKDIEKAVNFYNLVFQLSLEILDFGHEKMALLPNDEGALSLAKDFNPCSEGVLASFNVSDTMEATIARIKANGGKLVIPKTKIEAEGRGYFATIIDCEGNKVGLHSKA